MEERIINLQPILFAAVDQWLTEFKANSVKAATYDRLRISYKLMRHYTISNIRINELLSIDIQRYLNQLVNDGYAMSTIRKQYNLLTAYLRHAYSSGKIANPIYMDVNLPSQSVIKRQPVKMETYTMTEQKRLLQVLEGLEHRSYGVVILMLELGLRVGEALCITPGDVLWDRRAIRIGKTLVKLTEDRGATFVQDSAKSDSSNRTIPLSTRAITTLEMLCSNVKSSDSYIFEDEDFPSLPFSYETVRYHLKIACEKAKVPYRGNHIFRHTFATNCYMRGCNVKLLSKLLGHANTTITYNIYIHLYGDELEEMRGVLE